MAITENFDVLEKAVAISFADLVSRYRMRLQSCPSTLSVVVESELCKITISLDVDNVFAVLEPGPEANAESLYDQPLALGLSHVVGAEHPEIAVQLAPFKVTPRRIRERVALLAQ